MRANHEGEHEHEHGWLGTTIGGRYQVQSLIGSGGMGTVFRAHDLELEETIALKMLRRDLVAVPGTVERFRREVKLARRVTHRNVARVFDIGEHQGDKFLTMELVEGEALSDRMRRAPVTWEEARRVCVAIAEGLAAAHGAGVVHRDLKPENVLLARDGRVVITDFGIARTRFDEGGVLRTMGSSVGTPAYMAPEQVEPDREVDARADIYAFGAVMFELFTGRRAWPGEAPIAVAAARLLSPPPDPAEVRPDLPPEYAEIIRRCIARKPADRFQSAEAAAMALRMPSPWHLDERGGSTSGILDLRTAPTLPSTMNIAASTGMGPAAVVSQTPSATLPSSTPGRALERPAATGARPSTGTPLSPPVTGAPLSPRTPTSTAVSSAPTPASAPKTVAVLPFRNTGGPEDEYLADGLTDELIDTLSMTPGLRVRSRGVVMPHKGTDADPREVGAKLDVGLVVEGSIRRTGSGVRITARVVSVRDGSQLWAKRFDRSSVDVFVVSDEVARAVAEALTLEGTAPAREAPSDPVAMDLYLRARQEYRRYGPEAVRGAVKLFEEALARAPDHPTIQSAHALACARLWWFGGEGGAAAGVRARESAERALAGAPHLGEPHLALSQVMWNSGDATGAAREIQKAIARAPTLAEAHALRGRILAEANRVDAAIKSLTTAATLDPAVPLALGELMRVYALVGRWAEIPGIAERAGQNEGPLALWFSRARFAMWRRDRAEAARCLTEIDQGARVLAVVRWMFEQVLVTATPSEAVDLSFFMARDDASARRRSFMLQMEAEVRAFHGQHAAALASIERSVQDSLFDLAWLERCPLLAPLRDEPRFQVARATLEERVRVVMAEIE